MHDKKKYIQLIHIAKHQLQIDEMTYRDLLKNLTGKTSSKDMTIPELFKVIENLRMKGFKKADGTYAKKSKAKKGNSTYAKKPYVNYTTNKKMQVTSKKVTHPIYKIRAIWIDMFKQGLIRDGSDSSLNSFIRHQMRNTHNARNDKVLVFHWQALNEQQADLILKRLYAWKKRLAQESKEKSNECK